MRTETPELQVLSDPERVAVLADPARRRLVEALQERPDSATGLARRLGGTRQRLNYHLRLLEDAGVLEVAEERPRRGATERVLRPVARRFVVDPATLSAAGSLEPSKGGDRFSATWLVALAARAVRELARLMERARATGKRLPTAGLSAEVRLAEPADFGAFVEDLSRAVGEVVARHHTEEGTGRPFRVMAGTYPAPRTEESDEDEAAEVDAHEGDTHGDDTHEEA